MITPKLLLAQIISNATALDPAGNANANAAAILNRILDILIAIAWPLGLIGLIFIAFQMVLANGKPDAMVKLKKYMVYLVVGIALIVGSFVLLRTVISLAIGT